MNAGPPAFQTTSAPLEGFKWPNKSLALAILLIGLTLIAYLPALRGGFIWDDDVHLTQNPCIVGPLGLKEIWTTRAARICPLVQTTFWVEHAIWGLNPLPYHLVNILMHSAGAVVLWQLLRLLRVRGGWFGAALWALHPVQVETVAWITELKNTQSCFFYLLAILFFVRSETTEEPEGSGRKVLFYGLSFVCGALAMASKSSTVILPVVLGLAAWWLNKRFEWRKAVKIAPFLLLSAAATALSIWTQHLEGANQAVYTRSALERFIVAGKVIWFYLGKLAWPHPLIFIYPRWRIDASHASSYLPTLAAGAFLLLCFFQWRPVFFAFAYFLVALLPVLGLVDHFFLRYSFVGDHFQYLASIGPLALAAAGLTKLFARLGKTTLLPWAGGLLILLLGATTWRQSTIYASNETLWRATLSKNPTCWMALNNIGVILVAQNQPDEAMAYCQRALAIRPDDAEAELTLGNIFLQTHRPDDAIPHFERALQLRFDEGDFGRAKAYYFIGNAWLEKNDSAKAAQNYRSALQFDSEYTIEAHNNLGQALLRQSLIDQAIEEYKTVVTLKAHLPPVEQAKAIYNLANALSMKQRWDDAIPYYEKAIRMNPDYADAQNNLGRAFFNRHEFARAITHYTRALEIEPQSQLFQNNLAWQLATCPDQSVRDGARAIALAEKANLQTDSKDPIVLNTLAAAFAENRRFPEAIDAAQKALRIADPNKDSGLVEVLRQALELYRSGKPYHQAGQ